MRLCCSAQTTQTTSRAQTSDILKSGLQPSTQPQRHRDDCGTAPGLPQPACGSVRRSAEPQAPAPTASLCCLLRCSPLAGLCWQRVHRVSRVSGFEGLAATACIVSFHRKQISWQADGSEPSKCRMRSHDTPRPSSHAATQPDRSVQREQRAADMPRSPRIMGGSKKSAGACAASLSPPDFAIKLRRLGADAVAKRALLTAQRMRPGRPPAQVQALL